MLIAGSLQSTVDTATWYFLEFFWLKKQKVRFPRFLEFRVFLFLVFSLHRCCELPYKGYLYRDGLSPAPVASLVDGSE